MSMSTWSKSRRSSTATSATTAVESEPCRSAVCGHYDLSALTIVEREDHTSIHQDHTKHLASLSQETYDPVTQRSREANIDLILFALERGFKRLENIAGFSFMYPNDQKPRRTLANLYKYYRMIGIPGIAGHTDEHVGDALKKKETEFWAEEEFADGTENRIRDFWQDPTITAVGRADKFLCLYEILGVPNDIPSLNTTVPIYRHGIKLRTLEEIGEPNDPAIRTYCQRPGCNSVDLTGIKPDQIKFHNFIHDRSSVWYNDNPSFRWLYDLEAGYYFDGVRVIWQWYTYNEPIPIRKDKTRKVAETLINHGWRAAPEYECLEPKTENDRSWLYGPCFKHRKNDKILCREEGCALGNADSMMHILGGMIGRHNVPELGPVTSRRPEPVSRILDVRFNSSGRKNAPMMLMEATEEAGKADKGKAREPAE